MLPLTRGLYSYIDEILYDEALSFSWYSVKCNSGIFYAARHLPVSEQVTDRKVIFLHQWVMGVSDIRQVDHINHSGLDNRRSNLRICDHQQNMGNTRLRACNTSGYKGVSWSAGSKKWLAKINDHGKQTYLGVYADPRDAARAYDEAAQRVFGEFAWLNFPKDNIIGGV